MDIKLNFIERGTGEPLVLLHGNGENGDYFHHQIEAFSERYRVIAVDTRGHGGSPRGTAPFTLEQFAADLNAFLEEQEIERCHLLGFSDGANIAMLFAMSHPEKVNKLILNGGNRTPKGVKRGVQWPIYLGWAVTGLISRVDPKAKQKHELLDLMVTQPQISDWQLRRLPMPVLVAAGERDLIQEWESRAIAQAIPKGRLIILPGDHFLAEKNPEPFNQKVLEFLGEEIT